MHLEKTFAEYSNFLPSFPEHPPAPRGRRKSHTLTPRRADGLTIGDIFESTLDLQYNPYSDSPSHISLEISTTFGFISKNEEGRVLGLLTEFGKPFTKTRVDLGRCGTIQVLKKTSPSGL